MGFLSSWVQQIVVAVIIVTIIEMILPNGNNKKYVKIVLGIYVVFNIMAPIVDKITKNNFEISSIVNVDKYKKDFETYTTSSKNTDIENTNENNIKQVYVAKLQADMKAKLKEKGFVTKNIEILLEENNEFSIKEIIIEFDNKKIQDDMYISTVNEIEMVNINVSNGSSINKIEEKGNNVTHIEKTEIIKYISDVYGVNEKKITIY